jgi:hypothetical protein
MSAELASEAGKGMSPEPRLAGRRIVGLDSWTRGAHHFERLIPALARRGAALKLVHLGSWGNDSGRPARERIGGLEVRDISSYGGSSLERMLDAESPDALILLSIETFAHRAMLRYCRKRAIPTLLLYHGLVNVQVTSDRRGSYGPRLLAHAIFVCSKLGKLMRRTLPCYLTALWRTQASAGDWKRFICDALRIALGRSVYRAAADPASDATATLCAVYTQADVEHAIRCYAFRPEKVRVVGNPDLGRFGMTEQLLGSRLACEPPAPLRVMYIDTGLVNKGLIFRNYDQFIAHLRLTAEALAAQGARMSLKLHPSHDEELLRRRLAGTGVEIVANRDLMSGLGTSHACIVEPTTLAMIPGLLGMPMFYAAYGQLAPLRYGPVLMSYPRGCLLTDMRTLAQRLSEARASCDTAAVHDWIRRNAGPTPVEAMPERVADAIEALYGGRDSCRTSG